MSHAFSKRHYEALAGAIRTAREVAGECIDPREAITRLYGVGQTEAEITAMLSADNPHFDGERFAQASGMRG